MPNPIQVLVIEDSVDDTFFIVRELQRGGFHVDFERVETAAAMLEAIKKQHWDLVISDYSMPRFSGEAALSVYLESGSDAPFIMVSGALGEERVVEMIKAGAHDCVLKDNLARLVPAVTRELQTVRERRLREQSDAGTEFLASIVQSCDDAIIGKDLEGAVVSWNPAAERLYGYSAVEMIGQSISIVFPSELQSQCREILDTIKAGGRFENLETSRVRKDGTRIEVSLTVSPIRDRHGTVIGGFTVSRGINVGARNGRKRGSRRPQPVAGIGAQE